MQKTEKEQNDGSDHLSLITCGETKTEIFLLCGSRGFEILEDDMEKMHYQNL